MLQGARYQFQIIRATGLLLYFSVLYWLNLMIALVYSWKMQRKMNFLLIKVMSTKFKEILVSYQKIWLVATRYDKALNFTVCMHIFICQSVRCVVLIGTVPTWHSHDTLQTDLTRDSVLNHFYNVLTPFFSVFHRAYCQYSQ